MQALQEPPVIDIEQLYHFVIGLRGGDLSVRLPIDGGGRATEIAVHLNRFAADIQTLLSEMKRISEEISEGRFGGQLQIALPPGPWRDAVEAMNRMEWDITNQIRDCVATSARLAAGSIDRPVTAPCRGETKALGDNLNAIRARMDLGAKAG